MFVGSRRGVNKFAVIDDDLDRLLCGREDALIHVGEDSVFGETAHLDYGEA